MKCQSIFSRNCKPLLFRFDRSVPTITCICCNLKLSICFIEGTTDRHWEGIQAFNATNMFGLTFLMSYVKINLQFEIWHVEIWNWLENMGRRCDQQRTVLESQKRTEGLRKESTCYSTWRCSSSSPLPVQPMQNSGNSDWTLEWPACQTPYFSSFLI